MKILFLGYSHQGSICLDYIMKNKDQDIEIIGVVTKKGIQQTKKNLLQLLFITIKKVKRYKGKSLGTKVLDRLIGRETPKYSIESIEKVAEMHQLKVYHTDLISEENVKTIKSMDLDLIVVASFGKKIPSKIIDIPKKGAINMHASFLPKYRGGCPGYSAIINGENEGGVTVHYMDDRFDTGDIICQEKFPLEDLDTTFSYNTKAAQYGSKILLETIHLLNKQSLKIKKQNELKASYCYKNNEIKKSINWNMNKEFIKNQVRACRNYTTGAAFTFHGLKKIYILQTQVTNHKKNIEMKNGEIIKIDDSGLWVMCGDGPIIINKIFYKGKEYEGELINTAGINFKVFFNLV
jgi:methionyl-tRNA formyltransferase